MKTILILLVLAGLNSCAFTISSDGSKSGSIDGAAIVQILATK
jgi:hypothetical protein